MYRLGRMKDAGCRAREHGGVPREAHGERGRHPERPRQIHGGYGVSAEYEVGRLLLEAKALEFGEGTSELHRKLIAEHALGDAHLGNDPERTGERHDPRNEAPASSSS